MFQITDGLYGNSCGETGRFHCRGLQGSSSSTSSRPTFNAFLKKPSMNPVRRSFTMIRNLLSSLRHWRNTCIRNWSWIFYYFDIKQTYFTSAVDLSSVSLSVSLMIVIDVPLHLQLVLQKKKATGQNEKEAKLENTVYLKSSSINVSLPVSDHR